MVDCAENFDSFYQECRALLICIWSGTTHFDYLSEILRGSVLVEIFQLEEMIHSLVTGACNLAALESVSLNQVQEAYTDEQGPW